MIFEPIQIEKKIFNCFKLLTAERQNHFIRWLVVHYIPMSINEKQHFFDNYRVWSNIKKRRTLVKMIMLIPVSDKEKLLEFLNELVIRRTMEGGVTSTFFLPGSILEYEKNGGDIFDFFGQLHRNTLNTDILQPNQRTIGFGPPYDDTVP
jgi:hypothetical protein